MHTDNWYAINEKAISHKDFGDEVVVIHFETGNYYSLRETAATLWKGLSRTPASPATLLAAFADPPPDAAAHIERFLVSLQDRDSLCPTTADAVNPSARFEPVTFTVPAFEAFEDLQALLVADVIHDTDERGWPHLAPNEPA